MTKTLSPIKFIFIMVSVFIAFCTEDVTGDTIIIEPGDDYTKIENTRAGDIVEIAPGTYQFRVRLSAHGTNTEPITIRARDADNRPVFDLSGDWCGNWPESWSNNRAIFHIEGSYYKICDLIFRGAHQVINSADASGIRTVQADNISVQNCLFEYNDNGIQGSNAAGSMSLIIYDIRGREIKKLAAGRQTAGTYKIVWEGFDNSGRQAAEGIYFAFLKVNHFQRVIRLILVR
jgi:hypothetical protein